MRCGVRVWKQYSTAESGLIGCESSFRLVRCTGWVASGPCTGRKHHPAAFSTVHILSPAALCQARLHTTSTIPVKTVGNDAIKTPKVKKAGTRKRGTRKLRRMHHCGAERPHANNSPCRPFHTRTQKTQRNAKTPYHPQKPSPRSKFPVPSCRFFPPNKAVIL